MTTYLLHLVASAWIMLSLVVQVAQASFRAGKPGGRFLNLSRPQGFSNSQILED